MLLLGILLFIASISGQNVNTSTASGYTNYQTSSTDNCTGSASICTEQLPYNISDPPDVYLNAKVTVTSIELDVSNLQARLNLNAQVASLVTLSAGVSVTISTVQIKILGVNAQVQLAVRFDKIVEIINRTLDSLDLNPLLAKAISSVSSTVG